MENLLLSIVPHVHEQDIELAVMHLHNEPDLVPVLRAQGVPVIGICKDRFRYFRRNRAEWREQLERALAFAEPLKPDVIHAHLEASYLFAPILAKKLGGVPVVHTVHTARAPWQTSGNLRIALLRRLILRRFAQSAKVLCVGEGARQYLAQLAPGLAGKTAVVENCVADVFTRPLPATKEYKFDIVMVGRLSPEKNHVFAMVVIADLMRSNPHLRVAVIGFGAEEQAIRSKIEACKLENNVTMLGRLPAEKVCTVLDRSHVHYMPSAFEGFGIAAAEALFRGLPSVLSDIPVLSSLFGKLPGVWTAKLGDVHAHSMALSKALDDQLVHDHHQYLRRFTASMHVAQLRAIYDEAVNRG